MATEKKNSLKRDKAIQGLTMALKSKEKEVRLIHLKSDFPSFASVTGLSCPELSASAKKFMRELRWL